MKYMLDTNICIYIIKKQPDDVLCRFKSVRAGDICISSVTLSELAYGVQKSQHQKKNMDALQEFILPLEIAPFDDTAAFFYGEIRENLEKKGTPIGSMDLLIAAHAQSVDLTLVTNNSKEFQRVNKLKIENWIQKD